MDAAEVRVSRRCGSCGSELSCVISQSVISGRLAWSVWCRCDECGDAIEECGWDGMPEHLRAELVAHSGPVRLRVDPAVAASARVRLLALFRRDGCTLADAVARVDRLAGVGVTGTAMEMQLLSNRLSALGITARSTPPAI